VLGVLRAEGGAADDAAHATSTPCSALDQQASWYDKHHLVPFAEFFPVPHFVRSWMRLMSLPFRTSRPEPPTSRPARGTPAARRHGVL